MATNILNLRGVTQDEIKVIDREGREWPLYDGMPLSTAVALMELAPAWDEGQLNAEQLRRTVDGVLAVFRRTNKEVTREDIMESFDVDDLIQIILFLSSRVEAKNRPTDATETSEDETAEQAEPTPLTTDSRAAKTKKAKER